MTGKPFRVQVDQRVLDDLAGRLGRARFLAASGEEPWRAGTDPLYLSELVAYWRNRYEWRRHEQQINNVPQFMVGDLHTVHVPGVRRPDGGEPLPLLLTHGHAAAYTEMLPLIPLLTDPAAHGGDPADVFDVVVPSLPGFVFSPSSGRLAELMPALGHDRFGVFGSDPGPIAEKPVGVLLRPTRQPAPIIAPDTLGAGLADSPAGLLAWLLHRLREDSGGVDPEVRVCRDDILTLATLYWTTGTAGTALRARSQHAPLGAPELTAERIRDFFRPLR